MKCVPLEKLNDHFQYVILLHFIFKNIKYNLTNHLLVVYSQFAEIRSRYSNRAVTYFNTTVGKYSCTLIKLSVLKHNPYFESIILSIICLIFEQCSKA